MNKQSIIGLVLIFAIFMGYMWWVAPSKEERAEMQRQHDSIVAAYADSVAQAEIRAAELARLDSLAKTGDSNALQQLNIKQHNDMGVFNSCTLGDSLNIRITNDVMTLTLSNMGAQVNEVVLSKYTTFDSLPLQLITPAEDNMNLIFSTEDNRIVNTRELIFTPFVNNQGQLTPITENTDLTIAEGDSLTIAMRAFVGDSNGNNGRSYLEFVYTLGNNYNVDFDINFHGLTKVVRNTPYMDFEWHNKMNRQEKVDGGARGSKNRNKDPEKFNSNVFYKPIKDDVDQLKLGRDDNKQVKTALEWVAFKQQFFCAILVADNSFENADLTTTTAQSDDPRYLCDMNGTIGLAYNNEKDCTMGMNFYFGPTKFKDLRAMHRGFEKMLPLGWWIFSKFVSRFLIIPVFNFLETFNWNYGIIIIVFTFLLRLVLFPLTYKSYQSSAVMRILKPEMDALNKKYPNQDQMMAKQQEMSRLQKRAGISPLAGCLPALIQLPILTAMFRFYPAAIELRQKPFLWCNDLSTYDSVLDFGFNIPLFGDHLSLFCLLMFGVQFFYTWYTMNTQNNTMSMPGMKFVMYFMPFMMLFIFNSQSAGLNLYYFCSLSLTMVQMILIRKFTSEKSVRARMAAYDLKHKNGGTQKKSKFQERMEKMQKMSEELEKQRRK